MSLSFTGAQRLYLPVDEQGVASKVDGAPALVDAELRERFSYHAPRPDQLPRYDRIRKQQRAMAALLIATVPACRELELALDALELVGYHANAGIARRLKAPPTQRVEAARGGQPPP